jgi:hypothetical protein
MFVPELFLWLISGLACLGLWCLVEEIINLVSNRNHGVLPIRLILLFENNAETVEWFLRRLHTVLRLEGIVKIADVLLVDVNSHDDTPAILAKISRNHNLFHAVSVEKDVILNNAGSSLVVDCRNADWVTCFHKIKILIGAKRQGVEIGG